MTPRRTVATAPLKAILKQRMLRDCHPYTAADLAEALGVFTRPVELALSRPWLTVYYADRLACAIGLHPLNIWPDYYERTAA